MIGGEADKEGGGLVVALEGWREGGLREVGWEVLLGFSGLERGIAGGLLGLVLASLMLRLVV